MSADPVPARPWRWLWIAGGFISLAVGAVGAVLPLLPTTPFVLLAAWCFARGSPRCEAWLMRLPGVGACIAGYRRRRGVTAPQRRRILVAAWAGLALSAALLWPPPAWAWAALAAAGAAATAAILRLPAARQP